MKDYLTTMKATGILIFALATIAACSVDDNVLGDPEITGGTPKSYSLTVEATKDANMVDGNAVQTRALSLDGKTLNATWSVGEEVSVYGVTGEGSSEAETTDPVGTLTAQGNGATATLKGSFIEAYNPEANAKLRLKFCSPNYTGQKGTLEYIAANCDHATADVTINEVGTDGDVTTTAASFQNQQAIVKFSLKKQDGTTPVMATNLAVKVGDITYDVKPDEAASDIFVAIPNVSNGSVTLAATANGHYSYEKTGVSFENGKYYSIGVKMTMIPTLGDLYYSDGSFSMTLEEGKTPIGVIAYVGTDAFTENGVTLRDGTTTLESHALVLCLKNAAGSLTWRREGMTNVTDMPHEPLVDDTDNLKRSDHASGYSNTKFLAEKTGAAEDYPAPYQAWNYVGLTAPANTTGWFLPSIQQWVKILSGLGGLEESSIKWQQWIDKNRSSIRNLETAMAKAGAEGTAYNGFPSWSYGIWSSSEATAGGANIVMVNTSGSDIGVQVGYTNKVFTEFVRPVLAF